MNLLVVAATPFEIKPLVDYLDIKMVNYPQVFVSDFRQSKVTVLITGVGMVNTAFQLGKLLAGRRFDLAINLGIAGSFNPGIRIGEVVNVVSEQFADFGAQDGDDFLDMFEMKLMGEDDFPFQDKKLLNHHFEKMSGLSALPTANGITVNKVHGDQGSIQKVKKKYNPDVESMEGAAFFQACLMEKVPFLQIRAISNKVERRNKEGWNIGLAIERLNNFAIEYLGALSSKT